MVAQLPPCAKAEEGPCTAMFSRHELPARAATARFHDLQSDYTLGLEGHPAWKLLLVGR